ncbi:MAG: CarD family transcriptional regulator, partial [Anaerovoracaceae bacterium]
MFSIGDLIVYGGTGVCRVENITKPNFNEFDRDELYYVLQPLYQTGTIYAPVDNDKVFMRKVITKERANELIDMIPE